MKRLLALALCTSMLASPALAQYYGGPPGYGGGGGGYRGGDEDDYEPRRPSRPRFDERRGDYGRGGYGGGDYGPPRGRFGNVCITSRGSCQTRPAPRNAPCRCDLPGGEKRGNVQ